MVCFVLLCWLELRKMWLRHSRNTENEENSSLCIISGKQTKKNISFVSTSHNMYTTANFIEISREKSKMKENAT